MSDRRKPRHRAYPLTPEVRLWAAEGLEVRDESSGEGGGIVVTGKPIMYGTWYQVRDIFGPFQERMHPGVADGLLDSDVRFLFNHDGLPLARTTSGTLQLTDSSESLQMRAVLDPRQQIATDLAVAIERGDVSQMSVGFVVARDEWDDDEESRDIFQFEKFLDVSAVTYPASPSTSVEVAQRMLASMDVESRARVRRLWKMAVDLRAGKVLSAQNAKMLSDALAALSNADNAVAQVDAALDSGQTAIRSVLDSAQPNDPDDDNNPAYQGNPDGSDVGKSGDPSTTVDGTGTRSEEDSEVEHKEDPEPTAEPVRKGRPASALRLERDLLLVRS